MIEPVSVWLIAEQNSRKQCCQIIKTLSRKLQFPIFEPHCTLYGRLKCDPIELGPLISLVARNHCEFSTKVKRIKNGNSKWKCLYLSLQMNDTMKSIFSTCKKNLSSYGRYAFAPHVSLAYGNYEPEKIYHAAKRISVPKKLNFSGISLVRTSEPINSWEVLTYRHLGEI